MPQQELCELTAVELAALLARKQVSARDVMRGHLAQIERINPTVNAIVTLVAEQAMAAAARADEAIVRDGPLGVLHGLPVAHKDLVETAGFRTTYEYFVLPVTQVEPFDVNTPYPTEICGTSMTSYIDWMRSCWYVTMMSNPAISVPAGFSATGLPVGLQIVGRHQDEFSVLQLAHAYEQATGHGRRRPPLLD